MRNNFQKIQILARATADSANALRLGFAHLDESLDDCESSLGKGTVDGLQRASLTMNDVIPARLAHVEDVLKKLPRDVRFFLSLVFKIYD